MASNNNFEVLWNGDVTKSIHTLANESTKLKSAIFKSIIMNKDVDKNTLQYYLAHVSNFISSWGQYAVELSEKMKSTTAAEGINGIEYSIMKDYIYADYDYASVLPFTDGLFKGIDSGKFETPEDITSFFEFTVNKAFKNRANSTAGLLDEVLSFGDYGSTVRASSSEASLFNSVKSRNMFNSIDGKELYKAIEKAAEFMMIDINKNYYIRTKDVKLLVSMINNVVEYMTYSLTAYATRIYAIGRYAAPYINKMYSESASGDADTGSASSSNIEITIMKEANEGMCREPENIQKFMDLYHKFLKTIGATGLFEEHRDKGMYYFYPSDIKVMENNLFFSKLIANPLREYIEGMLFNDVVYRNPAALEDARRTIGDYIYNSSQAIQGTSSPKQEIMHVIRGTVPENETVEGYRTLANDLGVCGFSILNNLWRVLSSLNDRRTKEANSPEYNNSLLTKSAEVTKMIGELYRELATAILKKARDIEMNINDLRNIKLNSIKNDLTIKIPGGEKSDVSSNDNMMSGVPDTTRMPTELMDIYSLPTMESLEMYDEYVRSIPGMEGDAYYEAVNVSQLINTIMSLLSGLKKRFDQFFTDRYFQRAIKWVKDHQASMQQMVYSPPMEVLPYQSQTTISHIDKMINGIQNGFTAEVVRNEDNLNKFIESLYDGGNRKLIELFDTSKTDPKSAATLYQNWILFGLDPSNKSNVKVATKKLETGDAIRTELQNVWFENVANCDATHRSLMAKAKEIDIAFNSLKAKAVGFQNNQGGDNAPSMNGNQGDQENNNNNHLNDRDLTEVALTRVKTVIDQLWVSLYAAITKSIKDQYKYIQEAHSRGRKS